MRVEDHKDFDALKQLHDHLHLHVYHRIPYGIAICACGHYGYPIDERSVDDLEDEELEYVLEQPSVAKAIAEIGGQELYDHLTKSRDKKFWFSAYKEKIRIEE